MPVPTASATLPGPATLPAEVVSGSGAKHARYRYLSPSKPAKGNRPAAEGLYELGLKAHRRGRLGEARQQYEAAIGADPSCFEARFNLGLVALQTGKNRDALRIYEYALALRPDSVDARRNFALALKRAGYPVDAAIELGKVLNARPAETGAHLSLANLYAQELDQPSLARSHYLKVLELEPTHAEASKIRFWLANHR